MPKVTVKIPVLVTLDVPEQLAARVSRDDLLEMARSAVPDSMTHPDPKSGLGGPLNGTQVTIDGVCQEDSGEPVFADVIIEHDAFHDDDCEFEFEDDGFTKAEK